MSLRAALSRLPHAANTSLVPVRANHVVSAPPRNKVSFLEKVCHGIVIVTGCSFVPAWVLVNIKEYRGRPE
ncbi:hypothetical protein O3P69_019190 [Scylla paramamosain]|uniref:Uncharacterized protein n=1 Tax=Scylla paramamosain TaxID=85552 RepID=A0AAW0SWF8_SCYPA